MKENQNTNEELQPQALPDAQVNDHSENAAPEIPITFPEIKEETPSLSTQPQTSNIEPQTINHTQETLPKWKYMNIRIPQHIKS